MMNFITIMNFHMNEKSIFTTTMNIHHIDEFRSKWWCLIATIYYHNHDFSSNWLMYLIDITINTFLHHDAFSSLKLICIVIMYFHQIINDFHHNDEILKTMKNFPCNDTCSSKWLIFTQWYIHKMMIFHSMMHVHSLAVWILILRMHFHQHYEL